MAKISLTHSEATDQSLPHICVICGDCGRQFKKQRLTWYPSKYLPFLFLCFPIYLFLLTRYSRRKTLYLPRCDRHLRASLTESIFSFFAATLLNTSIIMFTILILVRSENLFLYLALMYVGILLSIMLFGAKDFFFLRMTFADQDRIELGNVSKSFADHVEYYKILNEE
jgi:hypothetical protein